MILIVDDDPKFLDEAYELLAERGRPLFARTAKEAFQLLEMLGTQLEAVVVDLDLPDVDGYSLIRHVRTEYPKLPVIAVSGVYQGHALEIAKMIGAAKVLPKPISPEWKAVIEESPARGQS